METQKGFIGIIVLIIVGFIGLAVLGSTLNLITIPWLKFDKQVQMNRDIVTKTYDADNALYNYHWFKTQAGDIKATLENSILAEETLKSFEASLGDRANWTFEDKTEDSRLRTISLGLKNQYNNLVNEYNARAKMADRSIFEEDLPLFFDIK